MKILEWFVRLYIRHQAKHKKYRQISERLIDICVDERLKVVKIPKKQDTEISAILPNHYR